MAKRARVTDDSGERTPVATADSGQRSRTSKTNGHPRSKRARIPAKATVNGGEVVDFGKGLGEDFELFGEWPGFLKISGEIAAKVANSTQGFIDRSDIEGPYEQAFREVLIGEPRGTFSVEDVTGIPWIEIDCPEDLDKANRKTFPRISDYRA